MLRKLFQRTGGGLDHADPEERLAAVEKLAANGDKEQVLTERVTQDPDLRVRRAAIARLTDSGTLIGLLDDGELRSAAAERLAQVAPEFDDHAYLRERRIGQAERAEDVLKLMADAPASAKPSLILQAPRTLRAELAATLTGEAAWLALEKDSRGRDKSLNRKARDQLEALRENERQRSETHAETSTVLTQLQRFEVADARDVTRWRKLRETGLAQLATFQEHVAAWIALGEEAAEVQAQADGFTAAFAALVEPEPPRESPFRALGRELERFRDQFFKTGDTTGYGDLKARWNAAADTAQPEPDQRKQFEETNRLVARVEEALEKLIPATPERTSVAPEAPLRDMPSQDVPSREGPSEEVPVDEVPLQEEPSQEEPSQEVPLQQEPSKEEPLQEELSQQEPLQEEPLQQELLQEEPLQDQLRALRRKIVAINWPAEVAAPQTYHALQARQRELEQALNVQASDLADARERLNAVLDELEQSIEEGSVQNATASDRLARELIENAAASDRDSQVRRWRSLGEKLRELRDWQRFATSPKREALVDEITELANNPKPPEAQASAVKRLREAWRALGPLQGRSDHALFDRFNEQAEKAFEPCKAFFAAQREERAANATQAAALCDQLEHYLNATNWAQADMKGAEQILRTAREEWRRYSRMEHKQRKALEARFEPLQEALYEKIKSFRNTNLDKKRAIVTAAEALAEAARGGEPPDTEGIKALQRDWQAVGATPRKPDQELWKTFREHCDAVFNSKRAAFEANRQEDQLRLEQADALCSELAAALDRADHPVTAQELDSYRQRFSDLGNLRGGDVQRRRFEELVSDYRRALTEARAAEKLQEITEFERWDEALGDEAPHRFFEARLRATEPGDSESYRTLTIQTEIAAAIEGPADEREQRMALQVEMLNEGFRDRAAVSMTPKALLERWCGLPPVDDDLAPLRRRFFEAVRTLARTDG